MRKLFKPILAMTALAVSGLALMAPVTPASAVVTSNVPIYEYLQGDQAEQPVEYVASRKRHRNVKRNRHRNYDRRRHGNRYRHRRAGYRHYYRGRWYANQWWLLGTGLAIGVGAAASGGRCGYVSRQCTARYGYGNGNYWGCMRYDNCN